MFAGLTTSVVTVNQAPIANLRNIYEYVNLESIIYKVLFNCDKNIFLYYYFKSWKYYGIKVAEAVVGQRMFMLCSS